jgi:hypothetical protein
MERVDNMTQANINENILLHKIVELQDELLDLKYKYRNLSLAFNASILYMDEIFQGEDSILPKFLKPEEDKYKGCVKLARKHKELCDFCKQNKLGTDLYNSWGKFQKLINYDNN